MKWYRILALIALLLMLFSGACGGGAKGISLVTSPSLTPEHSPNVSVLGASGLKPQIHFTYSLEGHPSAGGFSVVALANEFTPKQPADLPYAISVQAGKTASEPKVALSASGQRIVLAHFRYDPNKYKVGGVYSSNCWPGTSDFLPVVAIVEPGVLLISNTPIGVSPTCRAG
jgi:hypothetical protein